MDFPDRDGTHRAPVDRHTRFRRGGTGTSCDRETPRWTTRSGAKLGERPLDILQDRLRPLSAGHETNFAGQHILEGAAGTNPRRSDDERLTLLDPQKPERTAAVVVGTAIARSRKSQKLLEALLGLVAGCPSRCALKLDRSGLEGAFAEAPSRAVVLEIGLDGGRDLITVRAKGADAVAP